MSADSRCSDRVVVLRWKANFVHGPCEDITEALCTSSELQCNAIGWSAYEIVSAAQLSVGIPRTNYSTGAVGRVVLPALHFHRATLACGSPWSARAKDAECRFRRGRAVISPPRVGGYTATVYGDLNLWLRKYSSASSLLSKVIGSLPTRPV
jgi:hypothetical protein